MLRRSLPGDHTRLYAFSSGEGRRMTIVTTWDVATIAVFFVACTAWWMAYLLRPEEKF
jgi:hypothetical protein